MSRTSRCIIALALVAYPYAAEARLYNYEDLPVGTRSFGMGNTAMAIHDDVGSIYYNPGVLAWAEGDQISAGVSAYSRIDTRTGAYVSLFKSAADNITRGGFLSVPAMVGGFFKKSDWTWGGSVLVPNAFVNSGTLDLGDESQASYESSFEDIWITGFGTLQIDEKNAVGLGIFYVSRLSTEKFSFVEKVAGSLQIEFIERMWDVNGFTAVAGYSRRENENFGWGVSLRLPVLPFGARGKVSRIESGAADLDAASFKPTGYPMPARLSMGMAYTWGTANTFAADLHLYAPYKKNLHPDALSDFQVDLRSIPSLHLGYEHFFKRSLGLRLGFFTNLSAANRLPGGISAMQDKVNMYGTTGALVFAKDSGEVSLGGWVQGGQGRSLSVDPSITGDVPRSNYFYGGVVASSYRF
jgi:long-subunit fatty acid transport protein